METLILANPVSGRGRGRVAAERVAAALRAAGHGARWAETRLEPPEAWLHPILADSELLVVVGGDGAVRLAAGAAAATGRPIYHYPVGTENLFAREWGMNRRVATLLAAIEAPRVQRIDLGRANGEPFVLMASVGLDAQVVYDLAASRGESITHLSYLGPFVRQFMRWVPPRITVHVDGERVDGDRAGCLIVGNCRQYGMRLDPACRATMTDGQLDVVFYPTDGRISLARWLLATRFGRHLSDDRLVYRHARTIEVQAAAPELFQLDGDRLAECRMERLVIEVEAGALPVLVPR